MLLEGVKLMFVGMGTVILFLCLIILLLQLVSRLARKHTAREFEALELERRLLAEAARARKKKELESQRSAASPYQENNEDDIAVIAAAIAAYEASTLQRC